MTTRRKRLKRTHPLHRILIRNGSKLQVNPRINKGMMILKIKGVSQR
jgi:hypothetical protein